MKTKILSTLIVLVAGFLSGRDLYLMASVKWSYSISVPAITAESDARSELSEHGVKVRFRYVPEKDYSPVSFYWDFNDAFMRSEGVEATHVFTHAGVYRVELTTNDKQGLQKKRSIFVRINEPVEFTQEAQ